ncbi:reverse transcriptase domain-containing protein [Tanacetum coccineum]
MVPATTSLTSFSGETIWPLGQLRLLVTIRDADHYTRAWMNFMIVISMSPYNGIIGRTGIREIQAVPSTAHEMLKFPVDGGIVTIRSTILIPSECATMITSPKEIPKEAVVRPENFKPSDMTGVPRSVAEHRLNIREGYLPIRRKKMGQAPERAKAIKQSWRMCVDFTDLNKACPQRNVRGGGRNVLGIEELPHVLWAYRTTIKSSHGDTPFSLTYGTEAVIPAEIRMPTYRTTTVDVVHNDEELRLNLDLLEERRERAAIREAKAKLQMTKYYNARVRGVTFRPGDFVYRSNDAIHVVAGRKLGPKWEGPYEVTEALGDEAYRLRSMDGTILPRTWNIANLKKCYL